MPCQLIDLSSKVFVALASEALETTVGVTVVVSSLFLSVPLRLRDADCTIGQCRCRMQWRGRGWRAFIVEACAGDDYICGRYHQICKGV